MKFLPNGGDIYSDEQREAELTKDQKTMEQEKILAASKLFKIVNDKKFLDGEVKYDCSLYSTIDPRNIDYILVSKLDNIFALPFLTEAFGFSGVIIMTQPMQQIGLEMLKEFVTINEQRKEKGKTIPGDLGDGFMETNFSRNIWEVVDELDILEKEGLYISEWLNCYNLEDVEKCFERIRVINYGEGLELKGGLNVTAVSSGYHIGSSQFSLEYGTERLLVIDSFSKHNYRHSLPFNTDVLKSHSRILVTDCFNDAPGFEPANSNEGQLTKDEITINRFIAKLKKILKEHRAENILMPIRNPLFLLDILDILHMKVTGFRKLHVITSVFPSVVSYSNANVDYLNPKLQRKIYSKNPDLPISTRELTEQKRLEVYPDMFSFVDAIKLKKNYIVDKSPSIYLMVDHTMRLGHSAKLLEILNTELQTGTVLFTDPYLTTADIFFPLFNTNRLRIQTQTLNMNDSSSSFAELIKTHLKSGELVLPKVYKTFFEEALPTFKITYLEDNAAVLFPLQSKEGLFIKPQIYNSLKVTSVEQILGKPLRGVDLHVGVFKGGITIKQGKNKLEVEMPLKNETPAVLVIKKGEDLSEHSLLEKMYILAQELQRFRFQILNVEQRMDRDSVYELKLTGDKGKGMSVIRHSPVQTEIYCDDNTEYETILGCLNKVLGVCKI